MLPGEERAAREAELLEQIAGEFPDLAVVRPLLQYVVVPRGWQALEAASLDDMLERLRARGGSL